MAEFDGLIRIGGRRLRAENRRRMKGRKSERNPFHDSSQETEGNRRRAPTDPLNVRRPPPNTLGALELIGLRRDQLLPQEGNGIDDMTPDSQFGRLKPQRQSDELRQMEDRDGDVLIKSPLGIRLIHV
jgi:hypothetical protein